MAEVKFKENSFGFFALMDLEDMHATFNAQIGTTKACCCHAQQAIEKLFKHMRKEQGCKPGHPDLTGHNLIKLATACGYPYIEDYRQELLSLSKLYFERHYPNDSEYYLFVMPTWQEVSLAVELADNVFAWVQSELTGAQKVEKQGLQRMHLQ